MKKFVPEPGIKAKSILKNERGMALVTMLALLLILAGLGWASARWGYRAAHSPDGHTMTLEAFRIAQTGIQNAIHRLYNDPSNGREEEKNAWNFGNGLPDFLSGNPSDFVGGIFPPGTSGTYTVTVLEKGEPDPGYFYDPEQDNEHTLHLRSKGSRKGKSVIYEAVIHRPPPEAGDVPIAEKRRDNPRIMISRSTGSDPSGSGKGDS